MSAGARGDRIVKSLLLAVAVFVSIGGFSGTAIAQDDLTAFSWVMGYPVLDTRDFISNESFRGFCIEGRKFFGPNVSAGASASWHVFDQQTSEPMTVDNITVSGKQYRYINSFPLFLNAHYHTGSPRGTRLYLGANIGAQYVKQRLDIGLTSFNEDNWHFGMAPELGMLLPFGHAHILVSGKFHWAIAGGDTDQSYFSLGVGFAYSALDYLY